MIGYIVHLRIVMRHHDHRTLSVFIEHDDPDEAKQRAVAQMADLLPGKVIHAERVTRVERAIRATV